MSIVQKIKDFMVSRRHVNRTARLLKEDLIYSIRSTQLWEKLRYCTAPGTRSELHNGEEVIVSLTTFGKRINDVALTIESIMQGTVLPNRIILWLGEENRGKQLPLVLQNQIKRGLQVEYCRDIRSYTKLVPALRAYPDAVIITIDDDVLYSLDLVENLLRTHAEEPEVICSNRVHRIKLGADGKPLTYNEWQWSANPKDLSPLNFLTGVGGVLYPAHCFDAEVLNEQTFLDICKYADDIWFYAMALKSGRKIRKSFTHNGHGEDYDINNTVQDVCLNQTNLGNVHQNDTQFRAVFEKYNLYPLLKQQ